MADDLKNTGKGNLFVVFGEPDIEIKDEKDGRVRVKSLKTALKAEVDPEAWEPPLHLFGQIKRVVRQWIDEGYLAKPPVQEAPRLFESLSAHELLSIGAHRTGSPTSDQRRRIASSIW
jgi:hypothetical protein